MVRRRPRHGATAASYLAAFSERAPMMIKKELDVFEYVKSEQAFRRQFLTRQPPEKRDRVETILREAEKDRKKQKDSEDVLHLVNSETAEGTRGEVMAHVKAQDENAKAACQSILNQAHSRGQDLVRVYCEEALEDLRAFRNADEDEFNQAYIGLQTLMRDRKHANNNRAGGS